ncbi:MAG: 1-deoxy-D-xylulose-5-phosphate reductoisomerase [Deltaproteobacteria bacterium]|nr:1-deoxy-D-xylulose-5-phosphate reductoisomerase [Deltaproteobacteria bacterium]
MFNKKISILGSTGSIGVSTLDIIRRHPDRFEVVALAAGSNTRMLLNQVKEFNPKIVSVLSKKEADELQGTLPRGVKLLFGPEGIQEAACCSAADIVVSAVVGAAGLVPTLKAIEAGKNIALANKESMVIAGKIMSEKARQHNVQILPVDSEHSAIFQSLKGESLEDVHHLVLTASGGPFLNTPLSDFNSITRAQALKHPNWTMGPKITIDSATMMNKGLEVLEASWLFHIPADRIRVVIHPQSVIHSMVEFIDGSVICQMGEPDMRAPIAYALSYPRRIATGVKRLCFSERDKLTFFAPDPEKFKCLAMAFKTAEQGKSYAPVLNAANEVAVEHFLSNRISFVDISAVIEACLEAHDPFELDTLEAVLYADQWARVYARELISRSLLKKRSA